MTNIKKGQHYHCKYVAGTIMGTFNEGKWVVADLTKKRLVMEKVKEAKKAKSLPRDNFSVGELLITTMQGKGRIEDSLQKGSDETFTIYTYGSFAGIPYEHFTPIIKQH